MKSDTIMLTKTKSTDKPPIKQAFLMHAFYGKDIMGWAKLVVLK